MFISRLFTVVLVLASATFARADLQVFPTRVLLTESEKSGQIALRHKGDKAMRYRIDAVYYKMNKDGSMEKLADPAKGERTAIDYFRFSPRQVTLEPEIEQVVRILVRFPPELSEGEYYAHLYFEGIDEGDEKQVPVKSKTGAQMMLKARMAVAVPIIVRKGKPELKVALDGLKTVKSPDGHLSYTVEVNKTGAANLYGDFVVLHTPEGSDKSNVVGQANGVSSYIEKRVVTYPLSVSTLDKGKLTVEVREPVASGGKVLATATTDIK